MALTRTPRHRPGSASCSPIAGKIKSWMPGKPGHVDGKCARPRAIYPASDISGDNSGTPCWPLPRPTSLPIALALMTSPSKSTFVLGHRHLLGIEGLSASDIAGLLDLSEEYVELNRQVDKKRTVLRGRTQVNLFFEN